MNVQEAILTRRSVRHFTPEPVPEADILAVLEAGRWAPSGLNNQPWRFLVVRGDDPRREVLAGHTKYGRILREAAFVVAVFLDSQAAYHQVKDCQGVGACLQNMLLAAHGLGLGAVWIGEIINQEPAVTAALGLDPGRLALMAVIAAGKPAGPGKSSRKPLAGLLLEPLDGARS